MTVLTHAYFGFAFPAYPFEVGDGFACTSEPEEIAGAFRLVEDEIAKAHVLIGNGEAPEKFWQVERDEWERNSERYEPLPPFVEEIANPTIRGGLRRLIADMRAVARRCGEGKNPTKEVGK